MAKRNRKLKHTSTRTRRNPPIDTQRVFSHLEWRSREPIGFADRDLGQARLEVRGVYSIRIVDPGAFFGEFRVREETAEAMGAHLQGKIVARFEGLLQRRLNSISDLPGMTNDLATEMRLEIKEDFSRWGIHLIDFFVTSLTPTEDFQRVMDKRFQSPEAPDGTGNGSGLVGNGARPPQGTSAVNGAATGGAETTSRGNGFILPEALVGESPCPRCGFAFLEVCGDCGSSLPDHAQFCPGCGASQS